VVGLNSSQLLKFIDALAREYWVIAVDGEFMRNLLTEGNQQQFQEQKLKPRFCKPDKVPQPQTLNMNTQCTVSEAVAESFLNSMGDCISVVREGFGVAKALSIGFLVFGVIYRFSGLPYYFATFDELVFEVSVMTFFIFFGFANYNPSIVAHYNNRFNSNITYK
jgi:hypothetical protein